MSLVGVVRPFFFPSLYPLPPLACNPTPSSKTPFLPHGWVSFSTAPCPPITGGGGYRDENTTSVKSLILEIAALICADVSGTAGRDVVYALSSTTVKHRPDYRYGLCKGIEVERVTSSKIRSKFPNYTRSMKKRSVKNVYYV